MKMQYIIAKRSRRRDVEESDVKKKKNLEEEERGETKLWNRVIEQVFGCAVE